MAETPLIDAAKSGDVKQVAIWLDAGADVDQRTPKGDTALTWAAWEGHLEVVRLLLAGGADPTLGNESGYTPLSLAEKKGCPDIVQLINDKLAKAPLQAAPSPGPAPETWARVGEKSVAQVGLYPEIKKKLTMIFNFESRERLIIAENTATKAESLAPPTPLDDLPESLVRKALEEFTRLGGTADHDFVLHGQAGLAKTRREPHLK